MKVVMKGKVRMGWGGRGGLGKFGSKCKEMWFNSGFKDG